MIGIYKITNKLNDDCYIGQSIDIKRRWYYHKNLYNKDSKYKNYHIYRAFRKYGLDNFTFEVLEECKKEELTEKEQFYYDLYKPSYNQVRPIDNPMDDIYIKQKHKARCKEVYNKRDIESKEKNLKQISTIRGGRYDKLPLIAIHKITNEKFKFNSMQEAHDALGIPKSSISQILNPNHQRKSSKNYIFVKA